MGINVLIVGQAWIWLNLGDFKFADSVFCVAHDGFDGVIDTDFNGPGAVYVIDPDIVGGEVVVNDFFLLQRDNSAVELESECLEGFHQRIWLFVRGRLSCTVQAVM